MWSRTASRGLVRRSSFARRSSRAGVVSLAVLALAGVGLPAATAAPTTPDIPLFTEYVGTFVHLPANSGPLSVASPAPPIAERPVEVGFGGSVTFIYPRFADRSGSLSAELWQYGADGQRTRVLDNSTVGQPNSLTVAATGLVDGQVRIDMPTDDGVSGQDAVLVFPPFRSAVPALQFAANTGWSLHLTATGPASVDLPLQTEARSVVPCENLAECGVAATLTAGKDFTVSLPASSRITALGITDMRTSAFSMTRSDGPSDGPQVEPIVPLTAAVSGAGSSARLTVPAGTVPGRYAIEVVLGDGTGSVVSFSDVYVDVTAAVNPGLRSETGADAGPSSLLPVALGSAAALAVAGVAVRSRRAAARS